MISGHGSVAKAVEATKAGAFYFVEKPVEFEELMILIGKAVERGQQVEEIKHCADASRTAFHTTTSSAAAKRCRTSTK